MIINSCLKNMRGIRYDSAPILPNPFLDSHLNKLDTRNNARNHTLDQNELPSDTDDDEDLDVQVIEVQMPNVQGVIARSSDAEEGDGSDTEAPNLFSQQTEEAHAPRFRRSGSLRAQEEVVMETQDSLHLESRGRRRRVASMCTSVINNLLTPCFFHYEMQTV